VLDYLGLPGHELPKYEAYTRRSRWDGPPLSGQSRLKLQAIFEEPNHRLEEMLGRSLPW
jgi:hypothetical protein